MANQPNPYDRAHRATRKALLPWAIGTYCPCGRRGCTHHCDGIMYDPARMDLDHTVPVALGGTTGDRMVCAACNRSEGGRLVHRLKHRRASRDW